MRAYLVEMRGFWRFAWPVFPIISVGSVLADVLGAVFFGRPPMSSAVVIVAATVTPIGSLWIKRPSAKQARRQSAAGPIADSLRSVIAGMEDHRAEIVEHRRRQLSEAESGNPEATVTADEFAFDRATSFGDETADALFRTVESRPKDGLAKGVLADRLDEIGERWRWVSYAFRWCMKNGKHPYRAYEGEWWWNSSPAFGRETVVPPGLFGATGRYSHASYPTQLAAYLGLAEAIRRVHEEVQL